LRALFILKGGDKMIVVSLNGQSEFLTDYQIKERKMVVNGDYSLPFYVSKTERNQHAFELVQEETVIEYEGQKYRIKKMREYIEGNTPVKDIHKCQHVFFDIIEEYQYETLSGTLNIVQALNHAFSVTDWTWVNHGAFNTVEFQNFGDGTALGLFQTILGRYGAEFEITGEKEITLKNQIGAPQDAQFRYRHNIKTLFKDIDSSNVSTYIKGFGKEITAEYTSPNASVYGIRHAPPVRDERFTTLEGLQEHLQKVLIDTPNIFIEVEAVELKKQGIPIHQYSLGDTIFLIHEDLGIDATVRILEYTDYPESHQSPKVVLANYKPSLTKVMASFQQTSKTVKQLTDSDGNLSLQLKRLYRNSDHYSDHTGDWYISPDDPNAYVHIGAGGLDVHRGLVRVEREDGYATIIGGKMNFDFSVDSADPPFMDFGVTQELGWFKTSNTTPSAGNYYSFRHDARYLKFQAAYYKTGSGNTGGIRFAQNGGGLLAAKSFVTDNTHQNAIVGEVFTIDFGIPTGEIVSFYLQGYQDIANGNVYFRKIRAWLEG
jgi:phage minor structural protein